MLELRWGLSRHGGKCYYWFQRRTPCFGSGYKFRRIWGLLLAGPFFFARVAANAAQCRICRVSPRVRVPFTFNM